MPANPDAQLVDSGPAFEMLGLVHRVHIPPGDGTHPTLVMIHGLQGTEDVTWIFARSAGPEWLIVTPRAPFPAADSYSWAPAGERNYDDPSTLKEGLAALDRFLHWLPDYYAADPSRLVLLGFSQGAALAYAYAVSTPIHGIAALGGFIPAMAKDQISALKDVPVLILHGTRDETIPIETARQDRDLLIAAGAQVTYHESEVGHKVSTDGMRDLKHWLADRAK
jgi:phospholipase/carboxylesterase